MAIGERIHFFRTMRGMTQKYLDMLPDIRAFFESEEGKREFEEWKAEREKIIAEKKYEEDKKK